MPCTWKHSQISLSSPLHRRSLVRNGTPRVQTRKRRIYDVTNVLEGVGLIQKTGTNNVQWISPDEASSLSTRRFRAVHQQRLKQLTALRKSMESSIQQLTECIHQLTTHPENRHMLYVTQKDMKSLEGLRGYAIACLCGNGASPCSLQMHVTSLSCAQGFVHRSLCSCEHYQCFAA
jgi:thymidylate synthase